MAWSTESPYTSNVYDVEEDSGTVWDGGITIWDVVEQVIQTHWDVSPILDLWSKESGL